MKSTGKKISALFFVLTLFSLAQFVNANSEAQTSSNVQSITLAAEGSVLAWVVNGTSTQGFKVVWSKNQNPVYPTRQGDQYHYLSDPVKTTDSVEPFDGDGLYYARVCEYLGGKCGVYSNEVKIYLMKNDSAPVACTLEYAPVCGEKTIYCIKAPCPQPKVTYGNKCQLNAAKAKFLYSGECQKDEVKKLTTEEALKARISQLEARVKKLEKENRRLFSLIKQRESKIKALKEALKD